MGPKFVISFVVIFVLTVILDFIIHGVLLGGDYAQLSQLYRDPEDKSYMPFLFLGQACFAAGFVWIYVKGKEDKPFLMQGVRYGIAVAALAAVSMYLISYAVQPLPAVLVIKQIVFQSIAAVMLGIAVAWLNR
ncbi:MAG: hypothetical protein U1F33_02140 [Alphaproteobacteria bacterium]